MGTKIAANLNCNVRHEQSIFFQMSLRGESGVEGNLCGLSGIVQDAALLSRPRLVQDKSAQRDRVAL